MKKFVLLAATAAFVSGAAAFGAQAATVTCADNGKQVEAALKTAKLTATEKTEVEAKIKKADADCKAKKEADANTLYEAVLKTLKK